MRRRLSKTTLEDPPINLTPLIDVVFVILIMFIVVAPLLEMDQVDLATASPSSENASTHQRSPIVLHVFADNTITFNKDYVTLPELKQRLHKAHKRAPSASIELYHDKAACFGTYQSIKSLVEETGFAKLNVILKP